MTQARLRTLGLAFVAALGTMALAASAAQAANEFLLLHPGSTFAQEAVASEKFDGELEEKFRIIVPQGAGHGIEISCPVGTMNGEVYPAELHAVISVGGCEVYEIMEIVQHYWELPKGKATEPFECMINVLNIISMKVKAVPVLHQKLTYLLWVPLEAGQPFVTLTFSGPFCPLPPKVNLTGSAVSSIIQLNFPAQLFGFSAETVLLFQAKELPQDRLMYGVREAYFDAAFDKLALTGPFADEPWGAH